MEYAKIENGKITEFISTNTPPEGENWREVDGTVFQGHVGMDAQMLEWSTGRMRPEDALIRDGLLEDNRGDYWNTETRQLHTIERTGEMLPDGYTNVPPPDGDFVSWDAGSGAWVVDEAAREAARIQNIRFHRRDEFTIFDKYQVIPSLRDALSAAQKTEYETWRQAWLDATTSGVTPERPEWFQEW